MHSDAGVKVLCHRKTGHPGSKHHRPVSILQVSQRSDYPCANHSIRIFCRQRRPSPTRLRTPIAAGNLNCFHLNYWSCERLPNAYIIRVRTLWDCSAGNKPSYLRTSVCPSHPVVYQTTTSDLCRFSCCLFLVCRPVRNSGIHNDNKYDQGGHCP